MYIATVGLNKLSILLFYLRVFIQPWICRGCKLIMVLLAMGELAMVIQPILVCKPDNTETGVNPGKKCLEFHISTIVNAGWAMATDIVVLMLPMPALMALQVSRRRKIGLMVIFLAGLL